MNEVSKNKKRIVSQGQYVKARGKRIGLEFAGCGTYLLAAFCGLWTIGWVCALFAGEGWLAAGGILLFGCLTIILGVVGFRSHKQADGIDPGIPLTRIVADTLPAEESLVRASEEPIHEHQAILLRAATDNPETPAEQLVRPVGGVEEP